MVAITIIFIWDTDIPDIHDLFRSNVQIVLNESFTSSSVPINIYILFLSQSYEHAPELEESSYFSPKSPFKKSHASHTWQILLCCTAMDYKSIWGH